LGKIFHDIMLWEGGKGRLLIVTSYMKATKGIMVET